MAPTAKDEARTSKTRLRAVIKSARDIMRKDPGLNGDLDRLPQLSWLLFLRAFDKAEDTRRAIGSDGFRPALAERYRWHKWGADPDFTGEELLKFVNDDLLPYLRGLKGTREGDPRNVLSAVFAEIHNRMLSGYLLRDLINKLNEISFVSSDDIHTMAFVYESILKEMRDAAGDSGEFYTPRPVIRFMVQQSFLELGESILDPACGTGGFLVEAYEELKNQVGSSAQRVELHANLRGIEKKPLPYLLCMMNLLLHGIESPAVIRHNALVWMRNETSPRTRVDVVLTNPPFGGEEEASVAKRYPNGFQTKETAWLYIQGIIDRLKPDGRCAIVMPNGVLSGDGIGARIKEKLLRECELHTVVRLPQGVFAPYTPIPSNLLFFTKTGATKEVWFYEISAPQGRRGYSKTKPMRNENFEDCATWWGSEERSDRTESAHVWRVPIEDIKESGYDLDLPNPNVDDDLAHHSPHELISDSIRTGRQILDLLSSLEGFTGGRAKAVFSKLGDFLVPVEDTIEVDATEIYRTAGIYSHGRGLFARPPISGDETSYKRYNRLHTGDFVYSRLFGWEGALAVVPKEFEGFYVSQEFPTFAIDPTRADSSYVAYLARWSGLYTQLRAKGMGSRRQRVNVNRLLSAVVPLPSLEEQRHIAEILHHFEHASKLVEHQEVVLRAIPGSLFNAAFSDQL